MEEQLGLGDPRVAIDERDLAEAAGSIVGFEFGDDEVGALGRGQVDDATAGEGHLEPLDDSAAAHDQRFAQPDRAVGDAAVRAREHLLGRDVRQVGGPGVVDEPAPGPPGTRQEPDDEIRAVRSVVHRGQLQRVERLRPGAQRRVPIAPSLDRVRLVQPHRDADRLPKPVQIGLAEDLPSPAGVRRGHDAPGHPPAQDDAAAGALLLGRHRGDLAGVQPGHQVGVRVTGDDDQRGALALQELVPLDHPGSAGAQRFHAGVRDRRAAHVCVHPAHVDVAGAGLVGLLDDGAHDRGVRDIGGHEYLLSGLDIHPCPHDELGQALSHDVAVHAAQPSQVEWPPTCSFR